MPTTLNVLHLVATFLAASSVVVTTAAAPAKAPAPAPAPPTAPPTAARLNVTAIGTHNGTSRFECWQLDTPFISSNQSGLVDTQTLILGDVSRMTYNVVPAGFNGGLHPAPSNQWVVLLSGLGIVTMLDNSSTILTANGGQVGLMFAADTADRTELGHGTFFPGWTDSTALQIPTRDNEIPAHRVLRYGEPCTAAEVTGP